MLRTNSCKGTSRTSLTTRWRRPQNLPFGKESLKMLLMSATSPLMEKFVVAKQLLRCLMLLAKAIATAPSASFRSQPYQPSRATHAQLMGSSLTATAPCRVLFYRLVAVQLRMWTYMAELDGEPLDSTRQVGVQLLHDEMEPEDIYDVMQRAPVHVVAMSQSVLRSARRSQPSRRVLQPTMSSRRHVRNADPHASWPGASTR